MAMAALRPQSGFCTTTAGVGYLSVTLPKLSTMWRLLPPLLLGAHLQWVWQCTGALAAVINMYGRGSMASRSSAGAPPPPT